MNRDEMIEMLLPAYVDAGKLLVDARRQLWRMSTRALKRELLLRGLQDYEEPAILEDDEADEGDWSKACSALGWSGAPLHAD
jgi:hypothetical protein